jgi:Na+/H+ antiporter NhaD/arsenite permease-like protein
VKSAVSLAVMTAGFVAGWSLSLAALAGAAVLLFTRRVKPTKVLARIDGSLLLFFSALFIITRAVEATGGFQFLMTWAKPLLAENIVLFSTLSALLSNLISNVPAVMVLKPLIPSLADPHRAWLALAAASTLAGNLTLFGSVANLIVAESARKYGIKLGFGEYLKVGVPLALGSIALTVGWMVLTSR